MYKCKQLHIFLQCDSVHFYEMFFFLLKISDFKDRLAELDRKNRDTEKTVLDILQLLQKLNISLIESKINELKSFDGDKFNYDIATESKCQLFLNFFSIDFS